MNNNQYLIPANTKKGGLIFGLFQPVDLTIFLTGVGITLLLFVAMSMMNVLGDGLLTILTILPGLIATLLVIPIANYHNVRTIIQIAFEFYTTRQRFVWKGWCMRDGEDSKK